ncbi:hypothetical protein QAB16_018705 [Acinetobacter nosocomialis]|nr:hypothetical protein [Acinetobacter nosocomialis]MEC6038591.1 hypothetical protein [Acinetobacter nosocomialis]
MKKTSKTPHNPNKQGLNEYSTVTISMMLEVEQHGHFVNPFNF